MELRRGSSIRFLPVVLLICVDIFCQQGLPGSPLSLKENQVTEYLKKKNNLNFYSATNHLPVFLLNPVDNWFSPNQKIFLNGIPFEQVPFNFLSLNLIPVDILNIHSYNIYEPGVNNSHSSAAGGIELNTSIEDTSYIKMRGYFGSETDDPLIHLYTKDTIPHSNKNKIPLSGALSVSNIDKNFKYRFTAGYSGSFSTGSDNNAVFQKSNYFVNKQNKQLFASADFDYERAPGKNISLRSSLVSYYGWDIPPFISSYIHFETYIYSIRSTAENLLDGFSISIANDGFIAEVHKVTGILPVKIHSARYSILPEWRLKTKNLNFTLSPDISLITGSDINKSYQQQKYFDRKIQEISYGVNFLTGIKPCEKISININSRIDKHFSDDLAFSASSETGYEITENDFLNLSLSSVNEYPNLNDLYGNFFITENVNSIPDTFRITGSENLKKQRINYAGLGFNKKFNNEVTGGIKFYYQNVENPFEQKISGAMITESSGEIIRNAVFINGDSKEAAGVNINLRYSNKFIPVVYVNYNFTKNNKVKYFPEHLLTSGLEAYLPFSSSVEFLFYYKSRVIWEEFIVPVNNDFRNQTGYDGSLPEIFSFDFSYKVLLKDFYFFNKTNLIVTFQNILQKPVRFLPVGNLMERTILFSFTGKF